MSSSPPASPAPLRPSLSETVRTLLGDAWNAWVKLMKVLVPALLIVKLLDELGGTELLGALLAPALGLLGLPDWAGLVWAATLLTNLLTGMVLVVQFAQDGTFSVAQATVLGTLMLVGHSLPVEGAVARRAGVPWRVTIALRVGGALVLGGLLHALYSGFGWLQEPARLAWQPDTGDNSLIGWAVAQLEALALIFLIVLALMALLEGVRRVGLERLVHLALAPLLRLLGIGRSATHITVIGVLLGLTYGAGLMIRDVEAGIMSRRDSALALCFLGLVHSIVEDTLLILALGAHLSGILVARLVFAVVLIVLVSRLVPERVFAVAR